MTQTPNTSETQTQKNTITLLKEMGWQFITQEEINSHRSSTNQVILKDILLKQLQIINHFRYKESKHQFSVKNLTKAIASIDEPLTEGLNISNKKIADQLLLGNAYEEELSDGIRKSFTINYIDFDNIENNAFHFTEEFSVDRIVKNEREKTRIPDLVLFINGIPIGVIELKKSSIETSQGISQMIRNQGKSEIPQLFKYIQIVLVGSNHTPKYATVGTSKKFYASWEEENQPCLTNLIKNRTASNLDKSIYSLFKKTRILKLIHSFILFDARVKKIARYQQFFAIQNTLKKISNFDNTGRRTGGLIWHTQGSGKSLTMVMLAKEIKRLIVNSKIIIVTDRKDLDKQIHDTFKNSEIPVKKATSGKNLIELLQSGTSVITTIINKFEKVKNEKLQLTDENIFVLVDESHRSQSGDMHKAMQNVLVNSCYIGFTGTPLMKKDKNSFKKFGGAIHSYTINQAVKDKAILPLLYEGRFVDQWITDKKSMDKRFDKIAKNLTDEQKLDLKQKWTRFQNIAGSERRLEVITEDIARHFKSQVSGTGLKAMLATSSKYEAIKYHELFAETYPEVKTAFVISKSDNREGNTEVDEEDDNKAFINQHWNKIIKKYGDEDTYLTQVKSQFIDGDEINLLIVVDKLLTGFDAPRAGFLYIDKELKEHNLLQAIARVNRLYEGKDYGFIIDYRGLLGNLDKALTTYSSLSAFDGNEIDSCATNIIEEIAKVKTYYTNLSELFSSINNLNDQESYEVFLSEKTKRNEFYNLLSQYARALLIALPSDKLEDTFTDEEIKEFKAKMRFYKELRKSLKIRYFESVDFGQYEKAMQKLLDTFISANEVNQLSKVVNIFDKNFTEEVDRLQSNNSKADAILSAAKALIAEKVASNPVYYNNLSEKINKIIDDYRNKRLDEDSKLENANEIAKLLRDATEKNNTKLYHESIQHNYLAKAIYDNIYEKFSKLQATTCTQFILAVVDIIKPFTQRPDWKTSTDIKNTINGKIQDLLWNIEDEHNSKLDIDIILDTIRGISIDNTYDTSHNS